MSVNAVHPAPLVIRRDASPAPLKNDFAIDVRTGLTADPKHLTPKYFYDSLGSLLFEAICQLPEYYLTRAETEILTCYAADIAAKIVRPASLYELGSGSAVKSRHLIAALLERQRTLHYQPVDISESILAASAAALLSDYPGLRVTAVVGDYTQLLPRPIRGEGESVLALFLGSNIGNYDPTEARALLKNVRGVLLPGDALMIGADLKKDRRTLEAAYDDALGVTAAFNLNLLVRINRELGGHFDLTTFRHRALFNEDLARIEMHLESRRGQKVRIDALDLEVGFSAGEMIHTESSYKYDRRALTALALEAGFAPVQSWFDAEARFSCNLWRAE